MRSKAFWEPTVEQLRQKKQRQKKEKRIKRNEDNLRDLWDMLNPPIFKSQACQKRRQKESNEKILEEIIVENFPKMGKEITTQVQETLSPKQDKPKVKHPKTYFNQINEDQTQRTNIKSSKRKTTNNTQRDSHKDNSWYFNRNSSGQE